VRRARLPSWTDRRALAPWLHIALRLQVRERSQTRDIARCRFQTAGPGGGKLEQAHTEHVRIEPTRVFAEFQILRSVDPATRSPGRCEQAAPEVVETVLTETKLPRLTNRRALTPNSKRSDRWTLPQRAGLPSQHHTADDASPHDTSSTSNSPLYPQRMHDTSKILKIPGRRSSMPIEHRGTLHSNTTRPRSHPNRQRAR
jgi:hypothetical protein